MRFARVDVDNRLKECLTCGEIKSFDDFYEHRTGSGGRHSNCKKCLGKKQLEYNRRYYARHKEEIKEKMKKYAGRQYGTNPRNSANLLAELELKKMEEGTKKALTLDEQIRISGDNQSFEID